MPKLPRDVWDWWRIQLTLAVTGFTETGEVKGWWQGQTDFNRSLFVIVSDMTKINEIRSFVQAAGARMRQETMYFEYHETYFEEIRTGDLEQS